jgi:hypothetical protein
MIKVFTSKFYSNDLSFPQLIVIDEPDAHLHPEMSKILVDVFTETFVKNLGIKVIITTHSPSTVAVAPEDSIFQLSNQRPCSLKKISKDDALKILTTGLPNLSIDYKNHRQVFVEGQIDVSFYQTIFSVINSRTEQIHRLYFISYGRGRGNCNQVIQLVKELSVAGNVSSFGIVDWDSKNTPNNKIYVHGEGKRYSIENFIFDPLYLAMLLLNEEDKPLMQAIDFKITDKHYDLPSSGKAQKAIDYVLAQFCAKPSSITMDKSLIECRYGLDLILKIPKWILTCNGHELKNKVVEIFPILEGIKRRGEYEIENELIKIIGKAFPYFPSETVELITTLSSPVKGLTCKAYYLYKLF